MLPHVKMSYFDASDNRTKFQVYGWVFQVPQLKLRVQITDIDRRSQNSYTAPCNGVVSHGAPVGVFGFLSIIHAVTSLHVVWLFMLVYIRAQTAVHTYLTIHSYCDYGKNLNMPNWSLCQDKDSAGSGISGL